MAKSAIRTAVKRPVLTAEPVKEMLRKRCVSALTAIRESDVNRIYAVVVMVVLVY